MGEIVRQTINLYNTVGLVDKDKNIYFVPHQSDIYAKVTATRTKVCDCYHELFNTVSPFSSKYQNIDIDQWNPEDRSLVIDGLIDDFRQSRGQGLALNYMIVTRAIYEVNGETETLVSNYYQAFFIDSAEQSGSRSVRLSVSPDYFTNFFYLNNNDTLTSTYDPFNPVMKNCFIERQHYDRFKLKDNDIRYNNLDKILASEESFRYKYQYKDERMFLPITNKSSLDSFDYKLRYDNIYQTLKSINSQESFVNFISQLSQDDRLMVANIFLSYLNVIFKENILMPNSYHDSLVSKNYYTKLGFQRYKNVNVPYVHIALPMISIPNDLKNINPNWFNYSVYWKVGNAYSKICDYGSGDMMNPARVLEYLQNTGGSQYILTAFVSKYSTLNKNIYQIDLDASTVRIKFAFNIILSNAKEQSGLTNITVRNLNETIYMYENSLSFLPPTYDEARNAVVPQFKDKHVICIDPFFYEDSNNAEYAIWTVNGNTVTLNSNVTAVGLFNNGQGDLPRYDITIDLLAKNLVFVIGDNEFRDFNIILNDRINNFIDRYIDPLVESEPYTFYSLSIQEMEQIISSFKLIESYSNGTFTFNISPIFSYNDAYKVGLIPSYKINGSYQRYFKEALVTVQSSQVPIIEESWTTYYQLNKAQMKNQYAVQRNNYESAMYQGIIQGVTKMGVDFGKGLAMGGLQGGIVGGVTGALKGVADIASTAISNDYQVENIRLSQNAKMADMGAKPDTVKLAGSDLLYSLNEGELGFYINHYTIDYVSYSSICKYLERYGYLVNIYDSINVFDRIGMNFVKIASFDYVEDNFVLSQEQMDAVSRIFAVGVTLLHNKDFLHNLGEIVGGVNYHNYEYALRNI